VKEGDITLAHIPQDSSGKKRPVLILKQLPKYNDFLICAISTQVHQYIIGFDLKIDSGDEDFPDTGLSSTSVIRLSSLAVVALENLPGKIGHINSIKLRQLLKNLAEYLQH
jgi:mRNA interferase MazF